MHNPASSALQKPACHQHRQLSGVCSLLQKRAKEKPKGRCWHGTALARFLHTPQSTPKPYWHQIPFPHRHQSWCCSFVKLEAEKQAPSSTRVAGARLRGTRAQTGGHRLQQASPPKAWAELVVPNHAPASSTPLAPSHVPLVQELSLSLSSHNSHKQATAVRRTWGSRLAGAPHAPCALLVQAAASASSSLISRVAVNKELRELNFNKLQTEAVPRIVPVLKFSASINTVCHGPARWRPSSVDTWRKGSRHPAVRAGQGPSFPAATWRG